MPGPTGGGGGSQATGGGPSQSGGATFVAPGGNDNGGGNDTTNPGIAVSNGFIVKRGNCYYVVSGDGQRLSDCIADRSKAEAILDKATSESSTESSFIVYISKKETK